MRKLIPLAQRRANNTGWTQYVVIDALDGRHKIKMHPAKTYAVDRIIATVTPDADVRLALRVRRKTRGGNRVRVGSNVR